MWTLNRIYAHPDMLKTRLLIYHRVAVSTSIIHPVYRDFYAKSRLKSPNCLKHMRRKYLALPSFVSHDQISQHSFVSLLLLCVWQDCNKSPQAQSPHQRGSATSNPSNVLATMNDLSFPQAHSKYASCSTLLFADPLETPFLCESGNNLF